MSRGSCHEDKFHESCRHWRLVLCLDSTSGLGVYPANAGCRWCSFSKKYHVSWSSFFSSRQKLYDSLPIGQVHFDLGFSYADMALLRVRCSWSELLWNTYTNVMFEWLINIEYVFARLTVLLVDNEDIGFIIRMREVDSHILAVLANTRTVHRFHIPMRFILLFVSKIWVDGMSSGYKFPNIESKNYKFRCFRYIQQVPGGASQSTTCTNMVPRF